MELVNHIRAYHYLANVLAKQQCDMYCGKCSAWNNALNNAREALARFERERADGLRSLSGDPARLLSNARTGFACLANVPDPVGQKKAGNCKLPQGVCFVKASFGFLEKV